VSEGCPAGEGHPEGGGHLEGGFGAAGTDARSRRSRPFEGSVRQRRGKLLRQVIATGGVRVRDADQLAMTGLAQDGLVVLTDGWVRPPR
jgi:hypothetical protein